MTGLTYEAWDELAVERLARDRRRAPSRAGPSARVALLHRTGDLAVGEASVVVAVSSAHRAEAFEACRHGIEQLKHDVPIWKKETARDGRGRWVMGA